ncbi:MAG: hypothetical protein NVSMB18_07610 [Acetobacteraceae bacterium]
MSSDLFRLAYCSHSTLDAGELTAELARILDVSKVNNAKAGVTGAMLHIQGCFAQVLEGPVDAVQEVFERIQCDPRHKNVVVLQADRVGTRLFRNWDMALAQIGDPERANVLLRPALAEPSAEAGAAVVSLLSDLVCREAEQVF